MAPRLTFAGISLLLLFSASCSSPGSAETPDKAADSPPIVAVQKATFNNLAHSVALTAEFIPYQEVDVMAKVAGFVSKINVDIGDRVRTGQLLAKLEVPEMSDDLTRAAATVERSDAEIKRAKDDVERAKAAHEIAHLSSERLQGVSKARPGLVAQQELDDARSKDLVSEAQVSAAQSAYVAAQQASAVNRAEQSRFRTLYHYTLVTAPFDGVVTKRYANTGSMIQAGTASQTQAMPIVRLSQNNLLRLMLPVPESDVPRIHLGQQVDVRVPALNRSFAGKVSRFTDKVTTSTRTMETEVDVPNPGLVLVPGMYAEVDLQLEERSHVLSIPVTAVDLTSSAPAVYRVSEDGSVSIVPVRLGMETSDRVEVTNGLNDGDMVIVGNRSGMKAGDKVRPKMVEIVEAKANS
jgi:RND family efflux transporter MFP subunit